MTWSPSTRPRTSRPERLTPLSASPSTRVALAAAGRPSTRPRTGAATCSRPGMGSRSARLPTPAEVCVSPAPSSVASNSQSFPRPVWASMLHHPGCANSGRIMGRILHVLLLVFVYASQNCDGAEFQVYNGNCYDVYAFYSIKLSSS